ncbi:response regulator [Propionivibrio dicarboxylicus]|nr:response regulator [Propionivibrio dicarboxylicus]
MIVDDSLAVRSIIRRAITSCGYAGEAIHAVSSGMEALSAVNTFRPDLIITDWHMPGLSGLDFVRTLRREGHESVKVGMVTAETSEACMVDARKNGIEFILHKPFRDDDLMALIVKSVGHPVSGRAGARTAPTSEVAAIVTLDDVTRLVKAALPTREFSLKKVDAIHPEYLSAKVLVGSYARVGKKSVDALCIMDMPCLTLMAGAKKGGDVTLVQAALSTEAMRDEVLRPVSRFLENVAPLFSLRDKKPLVLIRSNLVELDKGGLKKALLCNVGLQVYELGVPGGGPGRFVFLQLVS